MESNQLKKLQSYNFAAYDMLLYLDTHPEDERAFQLYKELTEKAGKLKTEYEDANGPLTPFSAGRFDKFNWLKGPWPWQKEEK